MVAFLAESGLTLKQGIAIAAAIGVVVAIQLIRRAPRNDEPQGRRDRAGSLIVLGCVAFFLASWPLPFMSEALKEEPPTRYWAILGGQRALIGLVAAVGALALLSEAHPLGMRKPKALRHVVWGVALYAAFLPAILAIGQSDDEPVQSSARVLIQNSGSLFRVVFCLAIAIATPFFEEVVFRGYIQGGLRRVVSAWGAVPLSAFVFMLVHPPALFPQVFALGLLLGYVAERTRCLWIPVLLHAVHNLLTFLFLVLQDAPTEAS